MAEWLKLKKIATDRNVSDRTVRRWIAEGRLKAVRFSERSIRVHVDELARFDAQAARNIGPNSAA